MIRAIRHQIRLFFLQAWFSYRALFAWSTPLGYLSIKFGFPLFAMFLFLFMGKFVGLTDPKYIVLGNILLMPINNSLYGVSMVVANERTFGSLSYLLGSPAGRAPIFLGRAFFQIIDGFTTVLVALPFAFIIFKMNITEMNLLLVLGCILLITITTCGLGFLLGSIGLVSRDSDSITGNIGLALYVLVGVNFPVDALPRFLQFVAYGLPMTRGLQAARLALAGAGLPELLPLLAGEIAVGVIYAVLGYALFLLLERRSLISGMLDNV